VGLVRSTKPTFTFREYGILDKCAVVA